MLLSATFRFSRQTLTISVRDSSRHGLPGDSVRTGWKREGHAPRTLILHLHGNPFRSHVGDDLQTQIIPPRTRQVQSHSGIDHIEGWKHLSFPRIAPELCDDVMDASEYFSFKYVSCGLAIRLQFPVFILSQFLFLGQFRIVFGNRVP